MVLTDTLPTNATFVSATPAPTTRNGRILTFNSGTLANGASRQVAIVVTPTTTGALTNVATVRANESDPVTANNTASQGTTVILGADLAVTKADAPDPVLVGGRLTYTLTVRNNGPVAASGVTLTDTLPVGVTFVSATPAASTRSGRVLTFNLGSLANGASRQVTVVVTPATAGTLTNTASVTGAQRDPNTANNTATQNTVVSPVANLSLTKTAAPDPVTAGNNLVYTLTVHNNGPSAATNVRLTDTLPAGIDFIAATPAPSTRSGRVLTFNLGGLANAASRQVQITVRTTTPGVITNTASVTAAERDPNTANNAATRNTTVASPCAVDVTARVRITRGSLIPSGSYFSGIFGGSTGFRQVVTIENIGGTAITGPVSLALDNLSGATLSNANGSTSCTSPSGSPFIDVNVGDGVLSANESATVVLEFSNASSSLSYTARVLAGPSAR
ncbi:MAG: DUF11 domain-containing protein, partial [Armatimonadota bacterium]|nr:DUF11 domain-containing protein [Armatimonadota bacterium]